MEKMARESGTPKPATGKQGAVMPPVLQNDPQLLDLARLLDAPKAESSPAPSAAEADTEEADPGNDLSQHAEHDGDEPEAEAADASPTEESPETDPDAPADPAEDDPEAQATDPDATEAEDDEESTPAPKGLTPAAQHAFNKAIAKEKGRRRELQGQLAEREAELERLQAELNGLAAAQPEPGAATESPLLAKAKSAEEVQKLRDNATAMIDWADEQLNVLRFAPDEVAAAVKAQGAQLEDWTEETLTKWLLRVKRNAREVETSAPAKLKKFEQQSQFAAHERRMSAEAERLIPWLRQAKSPEMAAFNELLVQMPELKRRPNWKALAAAHVEGLKVIRARADKAAQATRQLTPKPVRKAAGEPVPVNPRQAQRAAVFSKLMKNGGRIEDVARFLE